MDKPDPNILLDIPTLQHAESAKWTRYPKDVLPLWVADMDFAIAPSIRAALIDRASRPLGYHHFEDPPLLNLLKEKLHKSGFPKIEGPGIHLLTGVVPGLYTAVFSLTSPGDDVLTMTPIYPPFLSAISSQNRNPRHAPLKQIPDGWQIDFDAMHSALTPTTRLLLLCHPHNPTGRVWTPDELKQLANFAEQHKLYVVSDELHADLTLTGPFIPFTTIASQELQQRTITLTGPCKTFNTAGLGIGAMISHNPDLITRLKKSTQGIAGHPNTMSIAMWRAALQDDGLWLTTVLKTLKQNRDTLKNFLTEKLPTVQYFPPEATYLAWLNFSAHSQAPNIQKYLLENAKVALNPGQDFGPGYNAYARLNFATSPAILNDALTRIAASL